MAHKSKPKTEIKQPTQEEIDAANEAWDKALNSPESIAFLEAMAQEIEGEQNFDNLEEL